MNRLIRIVRSRQNSDGGFAMIFTLFLILVITVTSVTVADLMISQVGPTGAAKKSVRTVDAASAGMQAALGQLRNTSTNGGGDLTKLPCSDPTDAGGVTLDVGNPKQNVTVAGDQITGTVLTAPLSSNTATYRTVIAYFTLDPTSHESDPTTTWWTNNAIPCKAGIVKYVPTYAFIQSYGIGAQLPNQPATEGNRTQHAVYQFNASNTNTVGGRMAEFNSGAQDTMCLDTGTAEPAAGTVPTMQPCLPLGTPQQTWQYRADLTLFYGGDTTLNLCIQNVTSTYGHAGTPELEPCATSGSGATYPYANNTQQEQEFAYNDNGQLEAPDIHDGSVGGGTSPDPGGCLEGAGVTTSSAAVAGAALSLVGCSGSSGDLTAWNPDPQVGAGKSGGNISGVPGAPTQQFVNYALFGNCLDVNGQQFNNKLIAYPCKQAPDSTTLTWNQIWHFQLISGNYGIFYTNCSTGASGCLPSSPSSPAQDCLASPGTLNGLVYGVNCAGASSANPPPANELWNATGLVAGNYAGSYLLINKSDGMCMAPDPSQTSVGWSQIVVTSCDGTQVPSGSATKNALLLKWNAPPTNPAAGLSGIQEDNPAGS
jgi:Tfp pilus assembly protein PilX